MSGKLELMAELDNTLCCISELEDYIIELTKKEQTDISVDELKKKFAEVFKEYTNQL